MKNDIVSGRLVPEAKRSKGRDQRGQLPDPSQFNTVLFYSWNGIRDAAHYSAKRSVVCFAVYQHDSSCQAHVEEIYRLLPMPLLVCLRVMMVAFSPLVTMGVQR